MKTEGRGLFVAWLLFFPLAFSGAQIPADERIFPDTGDGAIALRYLEWAQKELAAGRRAEALAALERGADYAAVSSDLSCFLALVRSLEGRPRGAVLEACRLALETNRWARYTPETALLLEAETLIALRRFEEALAALQGCNAEKYDTQLLKLRALRGLAPEGGAGAAAELGAQLLKTMDRFPRETEPVRLLFEYAAAGGTGTGQDVPEALSNIPNLREPVDLALKRLPVLLEGDPELAYLAAPFMLHAEDARRYVSAYRSTHVPNPASIPPALNLGLINGARAVEELFAPGSAVSADPPDTGALPELDRDLIVRVWNLLRSEDERNALRRNLLRFTGVITEDRDYDGIIETRTEYRNGMILAWNCDADQDGLQDISAGFAQGLPVAAQIAVSGEGPPALPLNGGDRTVAQLYWERYPAVIYTDLENKRYLPRPLDFFYTPFRFIPLVAGGPDYPHREMDLPVLTERSLLSFSVILEQPSGEFRNGTERIELAGGIPLRSVVYLEERPVSEAEYRDGRPLIQRLDLDLDGRMETVRRYDNGVLRVTESDWDGDGIYEYAETVEAGGTVKKSWDLNKDGIWETER
jgi:hypothetical protein